MTILENMSIADNEVKVFNLTKRSNNKRKFYRESQCLTLGIGLKKPSRNSYGPVLFPEESATGALRPSNTLYGDVLHVEPHCRS